MQATETVIEDVDNDVTTLSEGDRNAAIHAITEAEVGGETAEILPPAARAMVKIETDIEKFSKIDEGLSVLRLALGNRVFDCSDKGTMSLAKDMRRRLVRLRSRLEEAHKEEKAYWLEGGRRVDSERRRIEASIREIEEPIDRQITAETERVENERRQRLEAEAARTRAHESAVQCIRKDVEAVARGSIEAIETVKAELPKHLDARDWEEFLPAAQEAVRIGLESLDQYLQAARDRQELEELRKERAAAEARERAERAEREAREAQERKRAITEQSWRDEAHAVLQLTTALSGSPSWMLREQLDMLEERTFGHIGDDKIRAEAEGNKADVMAALRTMISSAEELEVAQAAAVEAKKRAAAVEAEMAAQRAREEEQRRQREEADRRARLSFQAGLAERAAQVVEAVRTCVEEEDTYLVRKLWDDIQTLPGYATFVKENTNV